MQHDEMELTTRVEMPQMARPVTVGDGMVFLGSCFAEHIGERFSSYGLPVLCNPVGVLYNPESIRSVVKSALSLADTPDGYRLPLFRTPAGDWRCWLAGTAISARTRRECEAVASEAFGRLGNMLATARHLFVTLGTSVCYRHRKRGLAVANCHKMPDALFEERHLSAAACVKALADVVARLRQRNPDVQIIFTVSPYRYRKYGFHGSQLAKATLLLAVDEVCRRFPETCLYLPVYEIFMDELRDYRFYAADMLHPADVAVDYVWQRLVGACLSERLRHYLRDYEPIRRALAHRPADPDAAQYQAFIASVLQRREALQKEYGIT